MNRITGSPFAFGLLVGAAVGSLTDVLQAQLTGSFAGLANAVSPWLVPAFFAGSIARRARIAALAGVLACLGELAAYVLSASIRGYAQSLDYTVFWAIGGLVGGVVFGFAGFAWSHPTRRRGGLGAALLSTAFLTEAAYFLIALQYAGEAVVFSVAAAVAFLALNAKNHQYIASIRWMAATIPCGALGELALYLATSRP